MVKKSSAPAWLVSDAIWFLRHEHSSVLNCVSRIYHETKYRTIEEWLRVTSKTWGTKLMTLITHMPYRWDLDMLNDVWLGIVARAMKEEGLVDPVARKLDHELRKKT